MLSLMTFFKPLQGLPSSILASTMTLQAFFSSTSGFNNDPTKLFSSTVLVYWSLQVNNDLNSIGHNKCKELFSNDFNLMWTRNQSGQESPNALSIVEGVLHCFFFMEWLYVGCKLLQMVVCFEEALYS